MPMAAAFHHAPFVFFRPGGDSGGREWSDAAKSAQVFRQCINGQRGGEGVVISSDVMVLGLSHCMGEIAAQEDRNWRGGKCHSKKSMMTSARACRRCEMSEKVSGHGLHLEVDAPSTRAFLVLSRHPCMQCMLSK